MKSIWIIALLPAVTLMNAQAFVPAVQQSSDLSSAFLLEQRYQPTTSCIDVLHTGIKKLSIYDRSTSTTAIKMSDEDFAVDATHERIAQLVEEHSVVLFMKGSKLFPQCGFSNTATQILQSYNIDFHTVDVLADENIRQGIKEYSQWPTIPQLFVCGEFIGGSDIMIEMYQSGELGELIEKAKADSM